MREKKMIYPAHILYTESKITKVQTVEEHCLSTSQIAAMHLKNIHLDSAGYLAGLVHDMGKFTLAFKVYIEQASAGGTVNPGSVIHTHGAIRLLIESFHHPDGCFSFEDMTAEMLAYVAGAHHGLFDCVDSHHRSGFAHRMEWNENLYREAKSNFSRFCANDTELLRCFALAHSQMMPIYQWINSHADDDDRDVYFYLGMLSRLLLSSVIQGDREDTAAFMQQRQMLVPKQNISDLWGALLKNVEKKLASFPTQTPIQKARNIISQKCKEAGVLPCGIYRLYVPTGGGKTLGSLRYALAHAEKYQKSRIIFTSPLLSILEQNAAVIRDFLENDHIILEHHSNVVQEKRESGQLDMRELMIESWDAPIIITTLVQLLDTLFSGKTSCVRRFQALSNSILVIDEVQTVPNRMLTLFNLAMNFLSHVCGATIILCSATQPCFEKAIHPILGEQKQLIPFDQKLWNVFQRTTLLYDGSMRLEQIPNYIQSKLEDTESLLVICNTKHQSSFLYQQLKSESIDCFHLSAAMCVQHRRDALSKIEKALSETKQNHKKVLCISTQIIEAGVDISFGCVIRMVAGMDNAVQAAGRCNRNGEQEGQAPVYLIHCSDEKLNRLPEILAAKTASLQLFSQFQINPQAFEYSLSSDAAISQYYQNLFGACVEQDYVLPDGTTLFDLLSVNDKFANEFYSETRFGLKQAFHTAGQKFQVFSQETTDIIVPYGEGSSLIMDLFSASSQYDLGLQKEILKKAKLYTVSIYQFQKERLERQGGLVSVMDGCLFALHPEYYDMEIGLTPEPGSMQYLEV